MTNFPVLLDKLEIRNYLKSLSSDKIRLEYLNDLKEELEVILDYYSDAELKNYIEENNLREKYGLEERNLDSKKVAESDKKLDIFEIIQGLFMLSQANLRMLCSKYSYLHFQIKTSLLPYINGEITKIENVIGSLEIAENVKVEEVKQKPLLLEINSKTSVNFQYSITNEELLHNISRIKIKADRLKYISQLKIKLVEIYDNNDEVLISRLLNGRAEKDIHQIKPRSIFDDHPDDIPKYDWFLKYLTNEFISGFDAHLFRIRREIKEDEVLELMKKGTVDDEIKYQTLDYKFAEILKDGKRLFPKVEEKIEYYSYVLLAFKKEYNDNTNSLEWENEYKKNDMKLLKAELDYLKLKTKRRRNDTRITKFAESGSISESHNKDTSEKTKREMHRLKVKMGKLIIKNEKLEYQSNKLKPKSNQDKDLVNHFVKVAVKINDVPSLEKLTSPNFKKSSWSKKLWNSVYLSLLYETINAKLSHKQLNDKNKNLYLLIIDFITKRADEIKTNHTRNAGSTSKTKPDFNDSISDEIQDVFNNL